MLSDQKNGEACASRLNIISGLGLGLADLRNCSTATITTVFFAPSVNGLLPRYILGFIRSSFAAFQKSHHYSQNIVPRTSSLRRGRPAKRDLYRLFFAQRLKKLAIGNHTYPCRRRSSTESAIFSTRYPIQCDSLVNTSTGAFRNMDVLCLSRHQSSIDLWFSRMPPPPQSLGCELGNMSRKLSAGGWGRLLSHGCYY